MPETSMRPTERSAAKPNLPRTKNWVSEAPIHRPKDVIEEQRHSDHARDLDEAYGEVRCETQPAANEELGECCRQYDEQKNATGNPGLETRRRFSNPLQHFMASRMDHRISLAIPNSCHSSATAERAHFIMGTRGQLSQQPFHLTGIQAHWPAS